MKQPQNLPVVAALLLLLTSCAHNQQSGMTSSPVKAAHVEIARAGSQASSSGAAENFTGHVVVTPLFSATAHTRATGGSVTFAPGAHSAWHSHPAGQTLIVTAGMGWVKEWGGKRQEIKPGDVVWTPPGVKHWHGATPTEAMTHIAIQEQVDGRGVDWMEQVSDEQYLERASKQVGSRSVSKI